VNRVGDEFFGNIQDIGFTLFERSDLSRIEINTNHLEPGRRDLHCQRQADITESDYSGGRFSSFELGL